MKLELKSYDKETIELLNIIYNNNHPINISINNKNYKFFFNVTSHAFKKPNIIKFNFNHEIVHLFLEEYLILKLIKDFIIDLPITNIDAKLKSIIIMSLSEDILNQFQNKLYHYFIIDDLVLIDDITDIKDIETPNLYFNIISEDNIVYYGGLSLNKNSIKEIASLYKKRTSLPSNKFDFLDINIFVLLDIIKLSYEEVSNLEYNDIIILDNTEFLTNNKIYIKTPISYYEAKLADNKITINSNIINITEYHMDNKNQIKDISSIPIILEFLIGQKTITIAELTKISPGYTFELDNTIEKPISILANGKFIANGELVKIDGKIGVRILEIFDNAG